jgi:atypical dual specificity phosphatase
MDRQSDINTPARLQQRAEEIVQLMRSVGLRPIQFEAEDLNDLAVPKEPRGFKITDDIFVSHWIPAFNRDFLAQFGIRSILSLDGKVHPRLAPALGVKRIVCVDMPDGKGTSPELIKRLVDTLTELATEHPRVLVHCNAGQSRSPAVVAAYLTIKHKMALKEAFERVRRERSPERRVKFWPEVEQAIREAAEE